jgi:deoxyadenosine/deoxycytidine kinase
MTANERLLIGIVGVCGAGKTTLKNGLEQRGYACRHIAQEHSYVPNMWELVTHPDVLIYLEATFPVCTRRRKLNWSVADYAEQLRRLAHARRHADLLIETDNLTPDQVMEKALGLFSDKS